MAHLSTSDSKNSDFSYDDAYRFFLITRKDPQVDYRYGRTPLKRDPARARGSFRGVKGFFKTMIEAIAKSKMRRIEREPEIRGIRYDRPNNDWVSCNANQSSFRKR